MKIKTVSILVLIATVWLQPCIAAEETPECQACKYLYDNLYTDYNNGNIMDSSYLYTQGQFFCAHSGYEYSHECSNILDQYYDGIYELLRNGVGTDEACIVALQICSCAAGEQISGDACVPCSRGYYNSGDSSSCTRCPKQDGTYGTTAATGSASVTDCYLPAGTAFSNTTGSGTYTGNCYYN